jgi:type I restriction enzyme S subunit
MFRCSISETTGERLDPHFHRPKFEELAGLLRGIPHATIRELVHFSAEQWDQKSLFESTFPYIEIGSVDLSLGRLSAPPLVPVTEAANRAKMLVRTGDLLISLTRPTRKAICFAPDEFEVAVASNGFCVVRSFKSVDLNSRYLFHILRSRLCTAQFDQRSSGGNYPAITEDQLSKVVVPIVTPAKQERIVKLLDAHYSKAELLFAEARADLEQAKLDIEAMILSTPVSISGTPNDLA